MNAPKDSSLVLFENLPKPVGLDITNSTVSYLIVLLLDM